MFNKRADGRKIKTLNPFYKMIPYIMKTRNDSEVKYEDVISIEPLEKYIKEKRNEGIKITHMDVIVAIMGRIALERPGINRFVMNRQIYSRNEVEISLAVKKRLVEDFAETTVKFKIKPEDTIFDISQNINNIVCENKKTSTENNTDKLADTIMKLPRGFIKFVVGCLIFLDNHNLLPKAIIDASPFHTSMFITNMGSLGIDSIYHHIYNFGTTGIFLAMGQKKEVLNVKTNELEKCISFKFVCDERICDGLYYARTFDAFRNYIQHPELLEVKSENIKKDIE